MSSSVVEALTLSVYDGTTLQLDPNSLPRYDVSVRSDAVVALLSGMRGLQQIPGYKGRNVSGRGRLVSEEPLLTAPQLQQHPRRFIALDYHRS